MKLAIVFFCLFCTPFLFGQSCPTSDSGHFSLGADWDCVQSSEHNQGGNPYTFSFTANGGSNVTAGDTGVYNNFLWTSAGVPTSVSISDTQGNTFTGVVTAITSWSGSGCTNYENLFVIMKYLSTAADTITTTWNPSGSITVGCGEAGAIGTQYHDKASSPSPNLDTQITQQNGTNGTCSCTITVGSMTLATTHELVGAYADYNTGAMSAGTGFTLMGTDDTNEAEEFTSSGSQTVTLVLSATGDTHAVYGFAIRPQAAAGGGICTRLLLGVGC